MSKENIIKFQDELQRDAKLKEKLDSLKLSYENSEELVFFAKEAGFEFTLEELKESNSKRAVGISDEELDKVVGGATNNRGQWITTVAFGCEKWEPSQNSWLAVEGQCGSCKHWIFKGAPPMSYLGLPGTCLCTH